MTFYGTVDDVEVIGPVVTLRCVRAFYHADGLMADDVWQWTITDVTQGAEAQGLRGRQICGFEVNSGGLKVWLDEGDESVTIAGAAVTKKEASRSAADLERVIADLSRRIQQDESEYLALTKKIRDIATSIYQNVDRLERRAAFEAQRRSESPKTFAREIEDLLGIVRRLEEPNSEGSTNRHSQRR